MAKQCINVPGAPKYPFSAAVRAGDFIFVSGQGGWTGPGTEGAGKDIEAQTRICIENMKKILEVAGSSLGDIVKVNTYLTDANAFAKYNEVYQRYFTKDHPARATVVTGLALPFMLVEMECVAYCPSG